MRKNKFIILGGVGVIVLIIVVIVVLNINKNTNEPEVSRVSSDNKLITPDQIKSEGLYNKETTTSSTGSGANPGNQGTSSGGNSSAQNTKPSTEFITKSINDTGAISTSLQYGIVSSQSPLAGWWIVKINVSEIGLSLVIYKATGDPSHPFALYAGPGTNFPEDTYNLPREVRDALWK